MRGVAGSNPATRISQSKVIVRRLLEMVKAIYSNGNSCGVWVHTCADWQEETFESSHEYQGVKQLFLAMWI